MRKKDREITDLNAKLKIIQKCKVCRLGLSDGDRPYIVPLNYGYSFEKNILTLFFHSAKEGKKLDIIKNNNRACFEIDCDAKLAEAERPCDYGYVYKSIIGFGKIFFLETLSDKIDGLNKIVNHQIDKETINNFTSDAFNNTVVYKLVVKKFTGKQSE
jgi:nitroimidazol reductase NimA-like FMN-containing flavoprotein (pyridoxamine 5'-phosphate oxidase superfamily)